MHGLLSPKIYNRNCAYIPPSHLLFSLFPPIFTVFYSLFLLFIFPFSFLLSFLSLLFFLFRGPAPLVQLESLWQRCKFPEQVRADPGRQTICGAFKLKLTVLLIIAILRAPSTMLLLPYFSLQGASCAHQV